VYVRAKKKLSKFGVLSVLSSVLSVFVSGGPSVVYMCVLSEFGVLSVLNSVLSMLSTCCVLSSVSSVFFE